jgi:hypothetical protein
VVTATSGDAWINTGSVNVGGINYNRYSDSGALLYVQTSIVQTGISSLTGARRFTFNTTGGGAGVAANVTNFPVLIRLTGTQAAVIRKPWEHYAEQVASADPNLLFASEATVFTPAARAALLDPTDPRVEEGIRIALDALERAAGRCAERCRLAVAGIPTKELVFAERIAASGVAAPPSYLRLVEDELAFWSRVGAFLRARRIPFVATTGALREALDRGEAPYLPDWNGHLNAAGNAAIAFAVGRYALAGVESPEALEKTKKSAKDPAPSR